MWRGEEVKEQGSAERCDKIREGEKLGLIGRSGSGKSVFMLMLRGVEGYAPDSGEIIFRVAMCPACSWVDLPSVSV